MLEAHFSNMYINIFLPHSATDPPTVPSPHRASHQSKAYQIEIGEKNSATDDRQDKNHTDKE